MTATDRLAARRSRVGASWLVAAVATVIAGAAHALGGGGSPTVTTLATALVVSGLVGMMVVGPRPTSPRILAGVAIDQIIFHGLFSFFGAGAALGSGAGLGSAAGTGAHAHHVLAPLTAPAAVAASTGSWAMTLHHVAAAALAFLLLRYGLDALARALTTLALRVRSIVEDAPAPDPVAPPPRVAPAPAALPPLAGILQRLELRRGPPLVAAV